MKANELMLGDWVLDTRTNRPLRVNPFMAEMEVPEWEPIPFTPEILEKNFELLFSKKGIYIYSGIEGRLIIQNHYNVKGWDWSLDYDKQTGTASAFGRVNYIHELQHCLRCNRIDKEIEL